MRYVIFAIIGLLLISACTSRDIDKTVKNRGPDEIVTVEDDSYRQSLPVQAFGVRGRNKFTAGEEAVAQKALSENPDNVGTAWYNQYFGDITLVQLNTLNQCSAYTVEYLQVSLGVTKEHVRNVGCFDLNKAAWLPQEIKYNGLDNKSGITIGKPYQR